MSWRDASTLSRGRLIRHAALRGPICIHDGTEATLIAITGHQARIELVDGRRRNVPLQHVHVNEFEFQFRRPSPFGQRSKALRHILNARGPKFMVWCDFCFAEVERLRAAKSAERPPMCVTVIDALHGVRCPRADITIGGAA